MKRYLRRVWGLSMLRRVKIRIDCLILVMERLILKIDMHFKVTAEIKKGEKETIEENDFIHAT